MPDAVKREIERARRMEKRLANLQAADEQELAHFRAHLEQVLHGMKIDWEKDGEALVMHVRWPRHAIKSIVSADTAN